MKSDPVATVEIDEKGRLHIKPATQDFPFAYREAMEVTWEPDRRSLSSPIPRQWSYGRWFQQILAVASAQGVRLVLGPHTLWINVSADIQLEIAAAATHAA
ncbi:hypothetical protein [Pseudoxanthomonas kalamensis]|uniref:hypothetical protein n=1 Tax=Pseudoxanthomonas kalamensis TaxID=289483 RepID=UPI001390D54C|nr:hypothetical protein [Pseudoxanthomonas kalamensis]